MLRLCFSLLCLLGLAAGPLPGQAGAAPAGAAGTGASSAHGCLPTGNGYLRARIRGALNLDIDWSNAELECDGGPRPDGSGVRVSFAGHRRGAVHEGVTGRDLPTNLTVIFEGEERLFATRGADHCTVDELRQERVGALGGPKRTWRIIARGYCIAPASTLASDARILVSRFDFAGNAVFE